MRVHIQLNSVMKMLLFLLLQVTSLTTLTQAFNVGIKISPRKISPESTVTINCTFDLSYEETNFVFIYEEYSDKLVYGQSNVENSGTPAEDYKDLVSNPQAKIGWFSIDFTAPYCYDKTHSTKYLKCRVYDWNTDMGSAYTYFYMGVPPPRADIYIGGSCVTCSEGEVYYRLSKDAGGRVEIQCRVDHVLPDPRFVFTGPFDYGWGSSVVNPDTCFENVTITRSATLSSIAETICTADNIFGEKKSNSVTIAPYTGVELLLPDMMEESTDITLNCTSDSSLGNPWLIKITNGTGALVYDFHFSPTSRKIGPGFEDMVSNPRSGENRRWASIDFRIPVAYTDTAFGCTFVGPGVSGSDRATFKRFYKKTN